MTTFHEQMKKAREEDDGRNIRDYPSWTLQDYRDFMFCVEKGYLVQDLSVGTLFMINEYWEGEDIYSKEFLDEEEEEEDVCCIGCNERVCGFNEEPPHKDSRDEAVCDACFEEEEEEDITLADKTCICKNNVNKRWTSDGCDVVCDDCQLGGKNDTWLRICYNCGQHPLKGKGMMVKCMRWIGEDCDDCSWICDKCDNC